MAPAAPQGPRPLRQSRQLQVSMLWPPASDQQVQIIRIQRAHMFRHKLTELCHWVITGHKKCPKTRAKGGLREPCVNKMTEFRKSQALPKSTQRVPAQEASGSKSLVRLGHVPALSQARATRIQAMAGLATPETPCPLLHTPGMTLITGKLWARGYTRLRQGNRTQPLSESTAAASPLAHQ